MIKPTNFENILFKKKSIGNNITAINYKTNQINDLLMPSYHTVIDYNGDGEYNVKDTAYFKKLKADECKYLIDILKNDIDLTFNLKDEYFKYIGDINSDGKITKDDYDLLNLYFNSDPSLLNGNFYFDINEDGESSLKDLEILQKYIDGKDVNNELDEVILNYSFGIYQKKLDEMLLLGKINENECNDLILKLQVQYSEKKDKICDKKIAQKEKEILEKKEKISNIICFSQAIGSYQDELDEIEEEKKSIESELKSLKQLKYENEYFLTDYYKDSKKSDYLNYDYKSKVKSLTKEKFVNIINKEDIDNPSGYDPLSLVELVKEKPDFLKEDAENSEIIPTVKFISLVHDVYPYMSLSQVKMYHYYFEKEGLEKANKYLESIDFQIQKEKGKRDAQKFIDELNKDDDGNLIDISVEEKLANLFQCTVKGLKDGIVSWIEGFFENLDDRRYMNSDEWQKIYILIYLDEHGGWLEKHGYNLGNLTGNFIIPMASSILTDFFVGPEGSLIIIGNTAITAGRLMAFALNFASFTGSSKHDALVNGASLVESWLYGVSNGLFQSGSELCFGSIYGISGSSKIINSRLSKLLSEGTINVVQDWVDAGLRYYIYDEEIDLKDLTEQNFQSFIYGVILSAGTNKIGKAFSFTYNNVRYKIWPEDLEKLNFEKNITIDDLIKISEQSKTGAKEVDSNNIFPINYDNLVNNNSNFNYSKQYSELITNINKGKNDTNVINGMLKKVLNDNSISISRREKEIKKVELAAYEYYLDVCKLTKKEAQNKIATLHDEVLFNNVDFKNYSKQYNDFKVLMKTNNITDAIKKSVSNKTDLQEIKKVLRSAVKYLHDYNKVSYKDATNKVSNVYQQEVMSRGFKSYKNNGYAVNEINNLNKKNQKTSAGDVLNVLNNLPKSLQNSVTQINVYDTFNPFDLYWEYEYGPFTYDFHSAATGGHGEINLYSIDNKHSNKTIIHEAAHNFDVKYYDQNAYDPGIIGNRRISNSKIWKDIVNADTQISGKKFVSDYSSRVDSYCEDFADSVAYYFADSENFRKKYPNRSNFFDMIFSENDANNTANTFNNNANSNTNSGVNNITSIKNIQFKTIDKAMDVLVKACGSDEKAFRQLSKYLKGDDNAITRKENARTEISKISKQSLIDYYNFCVDFNIIYDGLEKKFGNKSLANKQIDAYIKTGNLTYITNTNNARYIISKYSIQDISDYYNKKIK